MQLIRRFYRGPEDMERIRAFLGETLVLHSLIQRNWHVVRLDYWRWHVMENIFPIRLEEKISIWETPSGQTTAVLHPEGPGEAFFEVHPQFRSPELEQDMLQTAEASLAAMTEDGRCQLTIWAFDGDSLREGLLSSRGYTRQDGPEHMRWRTLDEPFEVPAPAEGFVVRPMGGAAEIPARSWASWRAFHPDDPDQNYQGWDWYFNVMRAPLYRPELDLVAAAPDGKVAGFCTVWFDPATRTGVFEPVGVPPEYQRNGLGKAMMFTGLKKLQELGAVRAYVGSYGPRAHALYASAGFTRFDLSYAWAREF